MHRTSEEWVKAYKERNALWIHGGHPNAPHVKLTSGNHSNGFFNSRLVISDEQLLTEAASDLVELYAKQGGEVGRVTCVVGPQTGATKLARLICSKIISLESRPCFHASPAKVEHDGQKAMELSWTEAPLVLAQSVLLCEDVCTTGGSVELAAKEVEEHGGINLPFMLVLVNRSGKEVINGRKIISLISRDLPVWLPEECPLCIGGSVAFPAKDNWGILNAG